MKFIFFLVGSFLINFRKKNAREIKRYTRLNELKALSLPFTVNHLKKVFYDMAPTEKVS